VSSTRSEVVGASWDGTARLWKAESPYRRWSSEPLVDGCGIVVGAKPDGRFVAVGCGSLHTMVWDTARDRLLAELPSVTPIVTGGYASAFPAVSSGGDRAAIARGDAVEVYDLRGPRLVHRVQHGGAVSAVAFAGSGRAMVSGAVDGSVIVTREDGTGLALQASAGVDVAELLPDGRVVVADAERHFRVYAPDGALSAEIMLPVRMMSLRSDGPRAVALPLYTVGAAPPVLIDLVRLRIVAELKDRVGQVFSARWVSVCAAAMSRTVARRMSSAWSRSSDGSVTLPSREAGGQIRRANVSHSARIGSMLCTMNLANRIRRRPCR